MKSRLIGALIVFVTVLGLLLVPARQTRATTSTITGTIVDAQGNPLNGYVTMQLPIPAQDTTTNSVVGNAPVTYRVVNGTIQSGPPLYDVAALQPQNLYYITRFYDTTGTLVSWGNYVVTGATYNLGSATPTNVTTSNISFISPASLSANQTFTGANAFTQPITESVATGTPPFTISSTSLVPNLNIDLLNGVTVSGSPSVGQVLTATSASAAAWQTSMTGGAAPGCTNNTPVTVSNSSVQNNLMSCSIPASTLVAGSLVQVDITGVNTTASGFTYTLTTSVSIGGGTACQNTSATTAAANNQPWNVIAKFFVITGGASGTANWSCEFFSSASGGGGVAGPGGVVGNPTIGINTTIANTIQVTETMSVANAGDSVTEQGLKAVVF